MAWLAFSALVHPDGQRIAVVVFIQNFFDDLRRVTPATMR